MIELIIGAFMVTLTVLVHAFALDRLVRLLDIGGPIIRRQIKTNLWRVVFLTFAVLGVFFAHIIQIWLWAIFYILCGALDSFEEALYFSTSTFTTVGYGDIVLDKSWRLISSFQAANGFLLFGWSTAFIFEVMNKLYKRETIGAESVDHV